MPRPPPKSTLFPYTTLFRSRELAKLVPGAVLSVAGEGGGSGPIFYTLSGPEDVIQDAADKLANFIRQIPGTVNVQTGARSEEHTSELQSRQYLVCRLLLEKK